MVCVAFSFIMKMYCENFEIYWSCCSTIIIEFVIVHNQAYKLQIKKKHQIQTITHAKWSMSIFFN